MFQRALNKLERQKVHLGQSGLSTSDIHRWLRQLDPDMLCGLIGESMMFSAQLGCLLGDVALDVAEFELIDRVRAEAEDASLPPAFEAPHADALPVADEDLERLNVFLAELGAIEAEAPLQAAIPAENFATTSYRLSLAALLGDPESASLEGAVADLARLPLMMRLTGENIEVRRFEVDIMSAGMMEKKIINCDIQDERMKPEEL